MKPDVVELARSLVRIPSSSGQERRVAELVAATMEGFGLEEVQTDGWGNVTGLVRGSDRGPTLLLDGHMDVVDPGSERWSNNPFGGEIAQGRLWGRGACDTKGSLAAMLCAAASLVTIEVAGTLVIAATVSEETVTGAALGHVLDRYPADVIITGEPTELRLGVAQKGRATFRLHARGRPAHTSQPEFGDNAVYKMIEAVERLRAIPRRDDNDLGAEVLELVEMVSEPFPNQTVVPDGCRARLVARTMPGETEDAFLSRIRAALNGISGLSVELDQLQQHCYTGAVLETRDFLPGWRSPSEDPWRTRLQAALRKAGFTGEPFAAPCGTNASEGAGRRGVPSFIFGPGSLAQAHIIDEWVSLEHLRAAQQGFAAMGRDVLGARSDTG